MSKPRYIWWGYVKGMIRRYPQLTAALELLKEPSSTPNYEQIGHGYGVSKPTELAALKELPRSSMKEWEAVDAAIKSTRYAADGEEKLQMIDLVYWHKTHTLEGASQVLHRSWRTVAQWHGDFIREVAKNYGLL